MIILRKLLGGLTSSIIRLLIVAAVLVAAYLILVKPAVDKTDDAVSGTERGIKTKVMHALHSAERAGNPKRLSHCVGEANGDVHKLQRCVARF